MHRENRSKEFGGEDLVVRVVAQHDGGSNEEALRIIVSATRNNSHRGVVTEAVLHVGESGEGPTVDNRAAEVREVRHVAVGEGVGKVGEFVEVTSAKTGGQISP